MRVLLFREPPGEKKKKKTGIMGDEGGNDHATTTGTVFNKEKFWYLLSVFQKEKENVQNPSSVR